MITITAYGCEFCRKVCRTKSGMSKHEKTCFRNPATRSCNTCKNLDTRETVIGVRENGIETVSYLYCNAFKCPMKDSKVTTNCPKYKEYK